MSERDGKCTVCNGTGVHTNLFFSAACVACGGKGTWKAQQAKK